MFGTNSASLFKSSLLSQTCNINCNFSLRYEIATNNFVRKLIFSYKVIVGEFMKKLIIIFLCCFVLSSFVVAQESYENEILVKVGIIPFAEYGFAKMGTDNPTEKNSYFTLPSISVEYLRYVNAKNALGFSLSYGCPVVVTSPSKFSTMYWALQGKYRLVYFQKSNFNLYSELGLGCDLFLSESDIFPFFAGQLSPLGISFGKDKLFCNAEIGIGTEGSILLLSCGVRF